MKNLIIALVLGIIACSQPKNVVQESPTIAQDTIPVINNKFNDPVFFMGTGSTYIGYMQSLFKLGRFADMLRFTSSGTIHRYGRDRLLKFYSTELQFGYTIGKLTSKSQSGDIITLNYANSVLYATKQVSRFHVIVENDSCKLILNSLKSNPF